MIFEVVNRVRKPTGDGEAPVTGSCGSRYLPSPEVAKARSNDLIRGVGFGRGRQLPTPTSTSHGHTKWSGVTDAPATVHCGQPAAKADGDYPAQLLIAQLKGVHIF